MGFDGKHGPLVIMVSGNTDHEVCLSSESNEALDMLIQVKQARLKEVRSLMEHHQLVF